MTNKDDKGPSDDLDDLDAFLAGLAPSTPGTPRPVPKPGSSPGTPRPVAARDSDASIDVDFDDDDDNATQIGQIPQELLAALGRKPEQQRAVTLPPPSDEDVENGRHTTAPPPPLVPSPAKTPSIRPPSPARTPSMEPAPTPSRSPSLPPATSRDISWDDADFDMDSVTIPPPAAKPPAPTLEVEIDLDSDRPTIGFDRPADSDRPTIGFDRPTNPVLPPPPSDRSPSLRPASVPTQASSPVAPRVAKRASDPPLELDDPFAPPTETPSTLPPTTGFLPEGDSGDEDVSIETDDGDDVVIDTDDGAEISLDAGDDEPILLGGDDDEVTIDHGEEIVYDEDDEPARPAPAATTKTAREPIVTLSGRAQSDARSSLLVALAESLEEPARSDALVAAAEFAERAGRLDAAKALLADASDHSGVARRALVRLGAAEASGLLADDLGGDVAAIEGASVAVVALRRGDERGALDALDEAWSKAIDPRLRAALASAGADLARSLGDARKAASMRLRSLDESATTGARVAAARELIELGDHAAASDVLLVAAEKEPRVHPSDALRRLGRRLAGQDPESISSIVASQLTADAAALRGDDEVERAALAVVESRTDADDRARVEIRLAVLDAKRGDYESAVERLEDARSLASRSAFVDATRDALALSAASPDRLPPTPLHTEEDAPIAALGRALAAADASAETIAAIESVRQVGRARVAAERLAADVAANVGEPEIWTQALDAESDSHPVGFAGIGVARALVLARAGALDAAISALGDGTLDLADAARAILLANRDRDAAAAALDSSTAASLHERHLRARLTSEPMLSDLRQLLDETPGDVVTALRLEQTARRDRQPEVEAEALERLATFATEERDRSMLRLLAASIGGGGKTDLELAPNDPVLLAEALLDPQPNEATRDRAIERLSADAPETVRAFLHARAAGIAEIGGHPSDAAAAARLALEANPDDATAAASVDLAELGAGQSIRIAHRLFAVARGDGEFRSRARAYARLSELDRRESTDASAAFASLTAALELAPSHVPTLRALESAAFDRGDFDTLRAIEPRIASSLQPGRSRDAHSRLALRTAYATATDVPAELSAIARDALDRATSSTRLLRWTEHTGRESDEPVDVAALERRIALAGDAAERVELWLRIAAVSERRNQADRVLLALGEAYAIEPTHPVVLFERAMALDGLPDDRAAAAAHELAAASSTSLVRASFHRLRAAAKLVTIGALDESLRILDAAREADPTNADVLVALVEVHERRDDPASALAAVSARIELGGSAESLTAAHELRGRLAERVGEANVAREAYAAVLAASPEDPGVLRRAADLAIAAADGRGAIDLLIRLARIERGREDLKRIFLELGDAYERLLPDARRAEASYRRVLQLEPGHAHANARLVEVLSSGGRPDDALVVADQLDQVKPGDPLPMQLRFAIARGIEKAGDPRRAEHLLEDFRKRAPTYVPLVMELAEFYARQGARPALAMHLGRSANDVRRAFDEAPSRANLECLIEVQRRRGRPDLFACTSASAAAVGLAVDGTGSPLATQVDPLGRFARSHEIDDLVAPRILTESTRAALRLASDAIERAFPLDARPFKVEKVPRDSALKAEAKVVAEWFGFDDVQLYVTPVAPRICVPVSAHPLTIIIGSELSNVSTPDERTFLFVRAAKIAAAGLAFAMRLTPAQVGVALHGLVKATEPSYAPQGIDMAAVDDAAGRLGRHLPKGELHALCLEMSSRPEFVPEQFGVAAAEWADRVALLATGKPTPALSGLIHLGGQDFAPASFERRIELLRSMPEAFGLLTFALSDMHPEARSRGQRS